MRDKFSGIFRYLTLLVLALSLSAAAEAADGKHPVRLSGHVPTKALAKSVFVEHLDANAHVPLTFTLPLRNAGELEDLLHKIYDPSSAHYHQYLTSEEFHARFSPPRKTITKSSPTRKVWV